MAKIESGLQTVWVFMGDGATHPAAVFTTRSAAELWITSAGVSGMLTEYPLNSSVYDHAIASGWFTPKSTEQSLPPFVQRFTSARQSHDRYESGE